MDYYLKVSDQEFTVIWAGLGEMPSKHAFATMLNLKAQIEQQEAVHAAGATNGYQGRSDEGGSGNDAASRSDAVEQNPRYEHG